MVVHSAIIFVLLLQVGVLTADDPQLIMLVANFGQDGQPGHILKLNIHYMNLTIIPVNVVKPIALDYDHKDGLIYFSDLNTKQIRRVDIDGGNDVEVARLNSTSNAEGLTLDPNTRQVFYTDNGNNLIGRVEMDNFSHTVIVNTGLDKPRGIVTDTKNKKLYWVDYGSNPKLETSDYDGGQRSTLIYSGLSTPLEITIDEQAGRLYWTDGGAIRSVNINGIDRSNLVTIPDKTLSHVALFNGFVYFTYFHDSDIGAMSTENVFNNSNLMIHMDLRPRGMHVFSPNFEVKVPCQFGHYGRDCAKCGACVDNEACEKTTGVCFERCQPGYTTRQCNETCTPGSFGDECKSVCNCKANSFCQFETGSCPNGCQSGWKGDNCSIPCTPGSFGDECKSMCNCKANSDCQFETGSCPNGCQSGWKGDNCSISSEEHNESLPIGLIAGAVGGVVAVIVIVVVVVVVVCIVKRKRTQRKESENYTDLQFNDNAGYTTIEPGNGNPVYHTVDSIF